MPSTIDSGRALAAIDEKRVLDLEQRSIRIPSSTFEEGKIAYDHRDAAGFIRLNALRLRTLAQRRKKLKLDE